MIKNNNNEKVKKMEKIIKSKMYCRWKVDEN